MISSFLLHYHFDSIPITYLFVEPFNLSNTAYSVHDMQSFDRIKRVFRRSFEVLEQTGDIEQVTSKSLVPFWSTNGHCTSSNQSSKWLSCFVTSSWPNLFPHRRHLAGGHPPRKPGKPVQVGKFESNQGKLAEQMFLPMMCNRGWCVEHGINWNLQEIDYCSHTCDEYLKHIG